MSDKRIWYPHYLADYDRDTADLTMLEHGAYRLLIDHYYRTGRPIPANAEISHRVCRAFAPAEKAAIDSVLHRFFVETDSGWEHQRIIQELERAANISKQRAEAAKAKHVKKSAKAPAKNMQLQHNHNSISLPEWLPEEVWQNFRTHRRKMGKSLTPYAEHLALQRLIELKNQGHDPLDVVEHTIYSGWLKFFPRKENNEQARQSAAQQRLRESQDSGRRVLAQLHSADGGDDPAEHDRP